jgi:hypothetical protein
MLRINVRPCGDGFLARFVCGDEIFEQEGESESEAIGRLFLRFAAYFKNIEVEILP